MEAELAPPQRPLDKDCRVLKNSEARKEQSEVRPEEREEARGKGAGVALKLDQAIKICPIGCLKASS